jgi:hypothetical protein
MQLVTLVVAVVVETMVEKIFIMVVEEDLVLQVLS